MKQTSKTRTDNSLAGVRILVGRARHQAGALSAELRKLGAQVIEIPFIEIRPPRDFRPLDSVLKNLPSYDWLILTSVNGVEAMSERIKMLGATWKSGRSTSRSADKNPRTLASASSIPRIAAIGPATKRALEQRGFKVDVVPKDYVAESVVRSLKNRAKGKRVLLVRAKVARDVIPRELRRAGALVDVVEAYETVVPASSRAQLRAALKNPKRRPRIVTFTSSSTVKNFVGLLGRVSRTNLEGVLLASIGPVTSATLRECGLTVDIAAKKFTIPGLVAAIRQHLRAPRNRPAAGKAAS